MNDKTTVSGIKRDKVSAMSLQVFMAKSDNHEKLSAKFRCECITNINTALSELVTSGDAPKVIRDALISSMMKRFRNELKAQYPDGYCITANYGYYRSEEDTMDEMEKVLAQFKSVGWSDRSVVCIDTDARMPWIVLFKD